MTVEIEVCERLMDFTMAYCPDQDGKAAWVKNPSYHAQIKDRKERASGSSPAAAIGNLIQSHPEAFGIKVAYLEGRLPR